MEDSNQVNKLRKAKYPDDLSLFNKIYNHPRHRHLLGGPCDRTGLFVHDVYLWGECGVFVAERPRPGIVMPHVAFLPGTKDTDEAAKAFIKEVKQPIMMAFIRSDHKAAIRYARRHGFDHRQVEGVSIMRRKSWAFPAQ